MTNLFQITISGQFQYAVNRRGQDSVRLFADLDEAVGYIHRRLRGEPAEVLIANRLTGASHVVQILPSEAIPQGAGS